MVKLIFSFYLEGNDVKQLEREIREEELQRDYEGKPHLNELTFSYIKLGGRFQIPHRDALNIFICCR